MPAAVKDIPDVIQALDDPAFWIATGNRLKDIARPHFRAAIQVGILAGSRAKPVGHKDLGPDMLAEVNSAADKYIEAYTDQWWGGLQGSTRETLRGAIARAQREGLGADFVQKQIAGAFAPGRVRLVSVTEVTRLIGRGAQMAYRAAGFSTWEWKTAMDARVDPVCEAREGQQYPMQQPFDAAHPGCRCWPVPVGRALPRA